MTVEIRKSPIPENEGARLRALYSYQVLDTAPEGEFDDLAMLASYICETPIALVSLVDSDRQWFKAKVGIDFDQTPRDESICQYTILGDQILEVPNTTEDPRFDQLPLVLEDPNGIRFYAGAPLKDPEGHQLGALCVIDTEPRQLRAEQKTALEALAREVVARLDERRRSAFLQRSNKRLDEFARIAAHDLKAPLRAIATLATFAADDLGGVPEAEIRDHLALIQGRARRMQLLVDGLLEYAQIAGRSETELTNPNVVIGEILEHFETEDRFEFVVAPDMPTIHLSPLRYAQVVQNLIQNAVKYHDKLEGRIEIGWRDDAEKVVFWVADDGPGIAPAYHEKIFGAFETLHARDDIESTGIGLAIVKGVVEEEGGKVWVESEEGSGATFFFTAYKATS